jgi:hypothetical protein
MNILFWLAVWIMMALAFGTAWTFIVKGCEAIDGEDTSSSAHDDS